MRIKSFLTDVRVTIKRRGSGIEMELSWLISDRDESKDGRQIERHRQATEVVVENMG